MVRSESKQGGAQGLGRAMQGRAARSAEVRKCGSAELSRASPLSPALPPRSSVTTSQQVRDNFEFGVSSLGRCVLLHNSPPTSSRMSYPPR